MPLCSTRASIKKTLLDQALFVPFSLLFILVSGCMTKGHSLSEAKNTVNSAENFQFWPAAQLLNFCLVPVHFQILYINLLGVLWQRVPGQTAFLK